MKKVACFLSVALFFLLAASLHAKAEAVYVWDFTDRSYQKSELTDKFTNDFETALANFGAYKLVERRQIDRLLAQAENEKIVTDASRFSNDFRNALKTQNADMVIFGTVYDDKESGQYNITVTFENFAGEKRLIKSCLMPRGMVNDAGSRMTAMENLVKDISERTASVVEINSRDLLFQLKSCTLSDNTIIFKFVLTNNGDDNEYRFYADHDPGPTVWDNFGNSTGCDSVAISNHLAKSRISVTLISGVPVQGEWAMQGISPKATSIPRLDIWYYDERLKMDMLVTFRNIEIQK